MNKTNKVNRVKIPGPPGTGKTYRLVNHYLKRELNEYKTSHGKILYVGFSNASVNEARKRINEIFPGNEIIISTLHALGKQTLNLESSLLLKGKRWKEFSDRFGHGDLEFDSTETETGFYSYDNNYLKIIEYAKNKLISRDDLGHAAEELGKLDDVNIDRCKQIYQDIEDFKRDEKMYEFSDMIKKFVDEDCRLSLDAIFLDEAQDLNPLQWEMFYHIEKHCQRSYVAGDDDQAIYSFQGASASTFINLEGEVDAQVQSNRVPKLIHEKAVSILANMETRLKKEWKPRPGDEGEVIEHMEIEEIDFETQNWMILVRKNKQMYPIIEHLENTGHYFSCHLGRLLSNKLLAAWRIWERLNQGASVEGREAQELYKECFQVKTNQVQQGFASGKSLDGVDAVTLEELKEHHGLLIEGDWTKLNMSDAQKEYIQGLLDAGEDLHKDPRIKISTLHKVKGEECENVILFTDLSWFIYNECTKTSALTDTEHRVWFVGVTRAKKKLYLMSQEPNKEQYVIGDNIT